MKLEIDKVEKKTQQLTKYLSNLQKQEKSLTDQVIKFEELNNKTDLEISTTFDDISLFD